MPIDPINTNYYSYYNRTVDEEENLFGRLGGRTNDPIDDYLNDEIPIIGGCRDPRAENYDRFATYDNGSCRYEPAPVDTSDSINMFTDGHVAVGFKSNPTGASILVDGVDVSETTPEVIKYGYKELLTAKIFIT